MSDEPCRCEQTRMLRQLEADAISEGYEEGFRDGVAVVHDRITDLIDRVAAHMPEDGITAIELEDSYRDLRQI